MGKDCLRPHTRGWCPLLSCSAPAFCLCGSPKGSMGRRAGWVSRPQGQLSFSLQAGGYLKSAWHPHVAHGPELGVGVGGLRRVLKLRLFVNWWDTSFLLEGPQLLFLPCLEAVEWAQAGNRTKRAW